MISIYEAELRRKPRVPRQLLEDQLTSRFFGALAMLPTNTVLVEFIRLLARGTGQTTGDSVPAQLLNLPKEDFTNTTISLWPSVGDRRPDVYIDANVAIVIIEVKKDKFYDLEKLKAEVIGQYAEARHKADCQSKDLIYFLLTNHIEQPPQVNEVQAAVRKEYPAAVIHWRPWIQALRCLQEIANTAGLDETAKKLIGATTKLLEEMEKMRNPFVEEEWFSEQISDTLEKVERLAEEIRLTFKLVGESIAQYGLRKVEKKIENRDDNGDDIQYPEKKVTYDFAEVTLPEGKEWIPKGFAMYYVGKDWRADTTIPRLYIWFSLVKEEIQEGDAITVGLSWKDKGTDGGLIREIKRKLKTKKYKGLRSYTDENEYLFVYRNVTLRGLADRDIVRELVENLVSMREFTESLSTFREEVGIQKARRQSSWTK